MPTPSRPMWRSKKHPWRLVIYLVHTCNLHACTNKYPSQVFYVASLSLEPTIFIYSCPDRNQGPPCRVPLTLPRQGWPEYFVWFFCPIHFVVDSVQYQLPSESQLLICPIKLLLSHPQTRFCGQVTQEKIDAVNAARAELEIACNPLKIKKPKKAKAE